jgi:2-hydroxymuconate-semialdehyde hydrolase
VRGEFVDLNDARLYYYAAGSRGAGEPVLFLHGFGTSGHLWSDVVSVMPAGHRLVVVDLLGHGRSDPPNGRPLTLRAHGERVIALLDQLGIREACVVGHGVGGGIAQSLALEAPARVSRLALVNSIAFHDWPTRDVKLAQATLPLTRHLPPPWLLSMVRSELERGFADPLRAAHALDKFGRPFTSLEGREALCQHIAALDAGETRALGARLREIAAPTSVIWGDADPFLSLSFARRLADAIPGASFEAIRGARHFTPEDAPRQVADAIADLLVRSPATA